MKVPCWNTVVNITQRSRETLASITQKTREKLGIGTSTENTEEWDEGAQRFAQTVVGRAPLRWSRPQEKQKKKRKFLVTSVVFLGLFAMMTMLSLLSHNSVAAESVQKSQLSSGAHTKPGEVHSGHLLDWSGGANLLLHRHTQLLHFDGSSGLRMLGMARGTISRSQTGRRSNCQNMATFMRSGGVQKGLGVFLNDVLQGFMR